MIRAGSARVRRTGGAGGRFPEKAVQLDCAYCGRQKEDEDDYNGLGHVYLP
jgi:hypothetical protein